ncbi:MAG: hypothetical protein HY916_03820 [Desulfovibrio sp.]|jgi:hypothetical protein|nr:hypothetical protein [Desulfovibrio sp.]
MGISGPTAFIAAQIQRDMPQDGTGSVSTASLANAAGTEIEGLKGCLADAISELSLRLPESLFSGEVQGDRVVLERKPAPQGLIAFVPAAGAAQSSTAKASREVDPEVVSQLMASAVSYGDRQDVAGRRCLVTALAKRPADEVEAILGSALWTKKKQGIRFWAAATKRLREAADDVAWAKRLGEAEDCMNEQQSNIKMLAVLHAKDDEARMIEASLAAGVLPSRVRAVIVQRKLEKEAKEQNTK